MTYISNRFELVVFRRFVVHANEVDHFVELLGLVGLREPFVEELVCFYLYRRQQVSPTIATVANARHTRVVYTR